jgi:hypothetical protein
MRQSGAERITVPEARARGESPLHVKTSLLAPVVTDIHVGLTRGFADYLADRKTDKGQHWRRRPSRPHLRSLHGLFSRDVLTFKWRCRTGCLPARRFRHWGFGQGGASRVRRPRRSDGGSHSRCLVLFSIEPVRKTEAVKHPQGASTAALRQGDGPTDQAEGAGSPCGIHRRATIRQPGPVA